LFLGYFNIIGIQAKTNLFVIMSIFVSLTSELRLARGIEIAGINVKLKKSTLFVKIIYTFRPHTYKFKNISILAIMIFIIYIIHIY